MKFIKKMLCTLLAAMMLFVLSASISCTGQKPIQTGQEAISYMENGRAVYYEVVIFSNNVEAYKWKSGNYTTAECAEIKKSVEKDYSAKELRSATTKYNCHSYAWYSTSSSNKYWINSPLQYINSATFLKKQTSGFNSLPSGIKKEDRAVYRSGNTITHSAIVNSTSSSSSYLKSKWGSWGLYTHSIKKCPYYSKYSSVSISYYRK